MVRASVGNYDPEKLLTSPVFSHIGQVEGECRIIHTAGQIAMDKEGNIPTDYTDQIRLALWNLDQCLFAAGASRQNLVKLRYYIVNYDPENRPHLEILTEYLEGHRPCTTLVPVPALARPELLFEIEAVAAVPTTPRPTITVNPAIPPITQVVVIGAGLSGLQAAFDLQKVGISTIILEARNRIGGKTWSHPTANNKGFVELGAAWTNDVNQPRVYNLARRLNLKLIEQNIKGNVAMEGFKPFPYGQLPELTPKDQKDLARVIDTIENLCQAMEVRCPLDAHPFLNALTFDAFVKTLDVGETVVNLANLWTSAMLGLPSNRTSAAYFLLYCKAGGGFKTMRSDAKGGGQALRFRNGSQSLSAGLAAALAPNTIRLSQPVTNVTQTGLNKVIVTTAAGIKVSCAKVILSVPSPLYQKIQFEPALSADKQEISKSSKLGDYGKCILVYSQPWWRDRGFCGLSQSLIGPVSLTRDTSDDENEFYSLTCFMVSEQSIAWSKKPARERHTDVMEQIDRIYGQKCPEPVEIIESHWKGQEWSEGAPCPAIPASKLEILQRDGWRPEGNLHFVGTETSTIWTGYMEGALTSGSRGAEEVILSLGITGKEKL